MSRLRRGATTALAAATLLLAACATDEDEPQSASAESSSRAETTRPRERPPAPLADARCPTGLEGCRSAGGRVVYVERVDPDGDGDAHFVLASRASITAPGISVIDVRRDLRPSPLPEAGDRISAAGPVYEGSFGQRQIEAVVVHTAR